MRLLGSDPLSLRSSGPLINAGSLLEGSLGETKTSKCATKQYPEGPSTQYWRPPVPKTILLVVFGLSKPAGELLNVFFFGFPVLSL